MNEVGIFSEVSKALDSVDNNLLLKIRILLLISYQKSKETIYHKYDKVHVTEWGVVSPRVQF